MTLKTSLPLSARAAAALLAAALALPAFGGPGAHGPDGEHLDAPAAAMAADAFPRLETHTEQFELVATLAGGELSLLVDRYATNEPVLQAQVEVESGALKAAARFHADHGDYAVDDAAFVQALSRPGAHPLVVTVMAGDESDLLEGTLRVPAPHEGDGHGHDALPAWRRALAPALALAALAALAAGALAWRRRRDSTRAAR